MRPLPHLFVIFGGTGDLAGRKLLPALARLLAAGHAAEEFRLLAVGRRDGISDGDYRRWAREQLGEADLEGWRDEWLFYFPLGEGTDEDFARLRTRILGIEAEADLPGNRVFYLALPPQAFKPTVDGLGSAGLAKGPGYTRVVVEKPFGRDLASARALNRDLHAVLSEEQIYRIDHYLGKETVQNLLVFRFGNAIFEDLWNRDRIESVEITVAEELGVGDRAAFYEETGAVRDIVQNHLAQILSLVAMEVPVAFEADAVRNEKLKVLRSVEPIRPEDAVFARYAAGNGLPGYREEKGVDPDSRTETYLAAKLFLDTWRWQGVPFYIRTGKRLPRKLTEISVAFRLPPVCLFESMGSCLIHSNALRIRLQPDEGFSLTLSVKEPGEPFSLRRIPLEFGYRQTFGSLPDAYETLLHDILIGDQTLFVHADETEASWRLFDPLLAADHEVFEYPAGSWGPAEAERLRGEWLCR